LDSLIEASIKHPFAVDVYSANQTSSYRNPHISGNRCGLQARITGDKSSHARSDQMIAADISRNCSSLVVLTIEEVVGRCEHAWVSIGGDKMNISDWIRSCARGALTLAMLVGYAHAQDTRSVPADKEPNLVLVLMDNLGWGEPGGILRGAPTPRIG